MILVKKKKVDTKRNFLSCGVIRKTTESSAVLLQQLKFNNGAADKILGLLVKKPTADARRFSFTCRERRSLKQSSAGRLGELTEMDQSCRLQQRARKVFLIKWQAAISFNLSVRFL